MRGPGSKRSGYSGRCRGCAHSVHLTCSAEPISRSPLLAATCRCQRTHFLNEDHTCWFQGNQAHSTAGHFVLWKWSRQVSVGPGVTRALSVSCSVQDSFPVEGDGPELGPQDNSHLAQGPCNSGFRCQLLPLSLPSKLPQRKPLLISLPRPWRTGTKPQPEKCSSVRHCFSGQGSRGDMEHGGPYVNLGRCHGIRHQTGSSKPTTAAASSSFRL
jgi:hypothetical protein